MAAKPQPVTVTEAQVTQLVKMLRLLGSDQMGERAAAAAKVHAWVQAKGLDWKEMLLPEEVLPQVTVKVGGVDIQAKQLQGEVDQLRQRLAIEQRTRLDVELRLGDALQKADTADRKLQELRDAVRRQPPAPHNPHKPGFAQAQAAHEAFHIVVDDLDAIPWVAHAQAVLDDHPELLRSPREVQFLRDQIARAQTYGAQMRISDRQDAWLRAILGRAGITW